MEAIPVLKEGAAAIIKTFGRNLFKLIIDPVSFEFTEKTPFVGAVSRPEKAYLIASGLSVSDIASTYRLLTHYKELETRDYVLIKGDVYQVEVTENNYNRDLDYLAVYVKKTDIRY